jgi:O-acetylhomoserine (thiol)-lyase
MKTLEEKLEDRIAEMEHGGAARVVSTRMAAVYQTVVTLVRTGDEIVSSINIRPETYTLFNVLLRDLGITVSFVSGSDPAAFESAVSSRTRFIFIEPAGQIVPDVYDVALLAEMAHKNKIPLVIDASTIMPVSFFPAEAGADIIIRAYSYGAEGGAAETFGVIIDAGHFDWRVSNVPLMKAADPVFGHMRWAFDLSPECAPYAFAWRFSLVMRRCLETSLSPVVVPVALEQLDSDLLQFQTRCKTAAAVAQLLRLSDKISWIRYPGLETDASYPAAVKQFAPLYGSTVLFCFSETAVSGKKRNEMFCNALRHRGGRALSDYLKSSVHVVQSMEPGGILPEYPGSYPVLSEYHTALQFTAGLDDVSDILADIAHALTVF